MPALVAPPRHCIPDITRKVTGETDALVEDLQPFACGMTGRSVEVSEPQSCAVQGVFPHWLQGQLYRNGPGVWDVETKSGETFSLAHWFDGLTVMHKFDIQAGCVTYRNRHLVKEMENYIREYNRPPNLTAYDDPCGSFMGRAFSTFVQAATQGLQTFEHYQDPETGKEGKVNVGVTVGHYRGNKLVSRTDANVLYELNPQDMEVIQQMNYSAVIPEVQGNFATSHVERDEAAGLTFNVVMDLTARGWGMYTLFCVPDDETEEPYVLAKVQDEPCYIHSFAATERYLILILAPCVLSPLKMLINKSLFKDVQWKPQNGVKFYVVDKQKNGPGHVATFRHDAFFYFHNINAFESGDDLCIDLAAYEDNQIIVHLHRANLLFNLQPHAPAIPRRYTLSSISKAITAGKDTVAQASSRDLLSDPQCFELFTISPLNKSKAYRYSYGTSLQAGDCFYTRLLKVDAELATSQEWKEGGTFPGEPIFVPHPEASKEDQGVLLSVVLAGVQKRSFLLVLDASNMQEMARAWTKHPVTLGFHGNFFGLDAFKAAD